MAANWLVNTSTIAIGVVMVVAVVITIVITIATYITATSIAIVDAVVVCGCQSGRNCEAILYVNEQYKHANQCNTADVISLM